ncbi:MAG: hypothetical protein OEY51_09570 [Cyclobacteriaceae bacterium]|nr:hypothetical protein [Cyclobacteriaceae bacterium]
MPKTGNKGYLLDTNIVIDLFKGQRNIADKIPTVVKLINDLWNLTPKGGSTHTEVSVDADGNVNTYTVYQLPEYSGISARGNDAKYLSTYSYVEVNQYATDKEPESSSLDLFGAVARFVGSTDILVNSSHILISRWVDTRISKLMNGTSKLHPSFMNLADDAPRFANSFLKGSKTLKLAKSLKFLGPVASGVGIGVSVARLATGHGTGWDKMDIAVNGVGVGLSILGAAVGSGMVTGAIATALVSNPVGWVIGGGILAYNAWRLYETWNE